jgi:predicted chitinase
MDQSTLVQAMGNVYISDEETAAFNIAMTRAGCTTVDRCAMFAAQTGHESEGLRTYKERWGPTPDQANYDNMMGNRPGEGFKFRGRGPIQVTGRNNYTACSQWAYDHGYVDRPDAFLVNPEMLESVEFGFLGAVWYWTTQRPLNTLSDKRDLVGATRAINGGLNGLPDRRARYERCLAIGEALLPEGDGPMAGEAQAVATQLVGPDGKGFESLLGRAVETEPSRGRYLTEAVAVLLTQLAGDPNFGGWAQLGDELKEKRSLVDGLARALEQLRDIQKRLAALEAKES